MTKKISLLNLLIITFSTNLVFSIPPQNTHMYGSGQINTNFDKRLEFFVGMEYFNPSFKQLNDGIKNLHERTASYGYSSPSQTANYLDGQSIFNIGIKYYFNRYLNLSLSIAQFNSDVSTNYFSEYMIKESNWPFRDINIGEDLTFKEDIRINPTLLTLSLNLPLREILNFYVGGGIGYYFSSIINELDFDFNAEYNDGTIATTSLLANIRTNANPLGYHLLVGGNTGFGIFKLGVEFGYHFATAKMNIGDDNPRDDDWSFYTQMHYPNTTDIVPPLIGPDIFDDLKIKKLDFSGISIRGNIGIFF